MLRLRHNPPLSFSILIFNSSPIMLQSKILIFEISATRKTWITENNIAWRKKSRSVTHFAVPFRLSRSPPCIIKFGIILQKSVWKLSNWPITCEKWCGSIHILGSQCKVQWNFCRFSVPELWRKALIKNKQKYLICHDYCFQLKVRRNVLTMSSLSSISTRPIAWPGPPSSTPCCLQRIFLPPL